MRRAQASLESLVLLGGLFAFVAVLWAASLPLQDAAMRRAADAADAAPFERLRAAVRLAAISAPGFSWTQPLTLVQNASLVWTAEGLTWSGPFSNRTLQAPFASAHRLRLSAGLHGFSVRRGPSGIELEVV